MALRLTSLVLILAACSAAKGEAFGRFGYGPAPVQGFVVTRAGFKTDFGAADMLRFPVPASAWKPVATTDLSQTVYLGSAPGAPEKLRIDLLSPGFSLYSRGDLKLHLSSTSGPILSWPEGSVEAGVGVPPSKWVLLSFRDSQPPILLAFLDGPAAVKIDGKVGDWTLTMEQPYKGWIRIAAPVGMEPRATNTAAELGALTQRVAKNGNWWVQPTPQLQAFEVRDEATAVVATWRFDRSGAIIPEPVALAAIGGYPIRTSSKTRRVLDNLVDGISVDILEERNLTVRFPMRRIPTGRALVVDMPPDSGVTNVQPSDIAGVTELALMNLLSERSVSARVLAQETVASYLTAASYHEEPFSSQRLPFDADGKGLDLAAAHALLMQAASIGDRTTSQPNSILTSLTWRRDWSTWRLWCPDARLARRAGALAALAGALCPEPERRLEGAMLEAGLAAERAVSILRARRDRSLKPEPLLEVMDPLRRVLFTFGGKLPIHDPFAYSLLGDLRLFGDRQVSASTVNGALLLGFTVDRPGPVPITLVYSSPLKVEAAENVDKVHVIEAFGVVQIRAVAKSHGTCNIKVSVPAYATLPPRGAPIPRYSEIDR